MKLFTRSLAVAALLCLAALHSYAQTTVTFASYAGAMAPAGTASGPLTWANSTGSGAVTLLSDSTDGRMTAAAIAGAAVVTYRQGVDAPAGVTTYTTTYAGNLAGATGSIKISADDTAVVTFNGVQLGATTPDQYDTVQTFAIPATAGVNGLNTLAIAVNNATGYTNVAFFASLTVPAPPTCAPTVTTSCTLPANAVKLGDDGAVFTILTTAAPVTLLYCAGTNCNPPVAFALTNPMLIGPNVLFGTLGAPGSMYLLPGAGPVTLTTAVPGPAITVPATQ